MVKSRRPWGAASGISTMNLGACNSPRVVPTLRDRSDAAVTGNRRTAAISGLTPEEDAIVISDEDDDLDETLPADLWF